MRHQNDVIEAANAWVHFTDQGGLWFPKVHLIVSLPNKSYRSSRGGQTFVFSGALFTIELQKGCGLAPITEGSKLEYENKPPLIWPSRTPKSIAKKNFGPKSFPSILCDF